MVVVIAAHQYTGSEAETTGMALALRRGWDSSPLAAILRGGAGLRLKCHVAVAHSGCGDHAVVEGVGKLEARHCVFVSAGTERVSIAPAIL